FVIQSGRIRLAQRAPGGGGKVVLGAARSRNSEQPPDRPPRTFRKLRQNPDPAKAIPRLRAKHTPTIRRESPALARNVSAGSALPRGEDAISDPLLQTPCLPPRPRDSASKCEPANKKHQLTTAEN